MSYHTCKLDIDGIIYQEDVECNFDVYAEEGILEPYSWGEIRGSFVNYNATLTDLKLGGDIIGRDQAVRIFGESAIEKIEQEVGESYEVE